MEIFSTKKCFGLDISDTSLECLLLNRRGRKIIIESFGRTEIEPGIIEDAVILNKEKLVEKIKKVIAESKPKKITSRRIILSLPESKTFIHVFESQKYLSKTDMEEKLTVQAAKIIPFEPEEIYADYLIYDNGEVLYVATPKKFVDDYLSLMKEVGLEIVAIDIESASLGRALLETEIINEGYILVADIGARTTNFSLFDEKKRLRTSATINVAGCRFTQAIVSQLKVAEEEAEKIKKECGLNPEKDSGRVTLILKQELLPLIEKIRQINKHLQRKIKKIILAGGSANLPKIADHFSETLNIKTEIGLSPIAKNLKERLILYNNVIGLALRGLKRDAATFGINLLNPILKTKEAAKPNLLKRKISPLVFFLTIAILLFAEALLFIWFQTKLKTLEDLVRRARVNIESYKIPSPTPILPEGEKEGKIEKEIIIQNTGAGLLWVRSGPETNFPIIFQVFEGEEYLVLDEKNDWLKIKINPELSGWVNKKYTEKKEMP